MIRSLEEKDFPECLNLLKQLTVVGEDFDYLQIFRELNQNKDYYIFVYEMDAKVVGMATVFIEQKFIHTGSRVGHIEDVVVSSDYRKMGIGQKLILKCVEIAKDRDCYKVILDCDEKNASFYEKSGFKTYGVCMKINF